MSVIVRAMRAPAITSGGSPSPGNQDFLIPNGGLGGLIPKAAIVIVTGATTNLTRADGARMSYGVVAENSPGVYGTFCIASSSDDGVTNTNCAHRTSITDVVCLLGAGSLVDARAQTVTFIADGVRLTWSDFPSTAVLVTVILFAGSNVSAAVGQFTQPDTIDGTAIVSSLSFGPEVLMVLGSQIVTHDDTDDEPETATTRFAKMMIGFAENVTITTPAQFRQLSRRWQATDDAVTAADVSYLRRPALSVFGYVMHDGTRAIEITAFSGSGFTATARLNATSTAYKYGYLALKLSGGTGSASRKVMTERPVFASAPSPSVPVDLSAQEYLATGGVAAPGLKPQCVIQLAAPDNVFNSNMSASPFAGTFGINCFTAFESFTNCVSDDDAATIPAGATESFTSNDLRTRVDSANSNPPPAEPNYHIATLLSFDPTGWTKRYTLGPAAGVVAYWPTLVIGEFVAPPVAGPVPVMQNSYRQRRLW